MLRGILQTLPIGTKTCSEFVPLRTSLGYEPTALCHIRAVNANLYSLK